MKKTTLLFCIILASIFAKADEGMWLPYLITQNYAAMQKLGFKLTPEDLYSVNKSSIKDAIVHFNGGCTGEMISQEGLVITNHHCGFDAIATLSSVQKNYLMNGFVANKRIDELPCAGLFVKFLVRVDDVTNQIQKATKKATGEEFDKKLEKITKQLEAIEKEKGYEIDLKPFFAGNKYYMLVFEKFTDIRLVATPTQSLGKFGGDTDNWMWPRHTCDFSMFRVYSNNENKAAAYSINNRPYQPKHSLPLSLKGVSEGDYTMVYGYPGRTQRYLTSYGVDLAINESNPAIVKIRDKKLSTMKEEMNKDMAVQLKYAANYASTANYWKYYIGQTEQLKAQKVLDTKQKEEQDFVRWNKENNKADADLFTKINTTYTNYQPYNKHAIYYREAFTTPALTKIGLLFASLQEAYTKNETPEKIKEITEKIKTDRKKIIGKMDLLTDKKLFAAMNLLYYQDIPKAQHPGIFASEVFKKYGNEDWTKTFNDYADYIYGNTNLLNDAKFDEYMNQVNATNITTDPVINYALNVATNYKTFYEPKQKDFAYSMAVLNKQYQAALLQKNANKQMYPDANGTMRLSYGTVKAYAPKDAVSYSNITTAEGLLEKYKAGDAEFDLQNNILDLLRNKDYGEYIDKIAGTLVTCFITNNDITGGNSGSPVLNANGELIGLAFDGNWEAMSGDIAFDQKYKRTICVDIRYVLWTIDKVLGGKPLMEEITMRR